MSGCSENAEHAPGSILWEHKLEVEHPESLDCLYLTVERSSGSIVVLGDRRLRAFDSAGSERWSRDFSGCQQIWDDRPGIGSLRHRFDVRGRELASYPGGLGRTATQDSQAHPIALGDELTKFDPERNPLWSVRLIVELGTPRAMSVVTDDNDDVIISWAAGGECPSGNVLRKYDQAGETLWSTCLELEQALGRVPLAVDGSDILLAGAAATNQPRDGGARDWLLQRYDASGTRRWSRPLATLITSRDGLDDSNENALSALAVDSRGNIFVVGRVLGRKPEVSQDIWVKKLDRDAREQWTVVVGGKPRLDDQGVALVLDASDEPYVLARMDHPAGRSQAEPPALLWLGKLAP